MLQLPEEVKSALDDKVFVHMATVMPDGSPQVSVIWIGRDGDSLLFSTAEGRIKTANIRRDPRVGLSFTTIGDDYRNYVLRGAVTTFEADGRWLIDDLARKYTDRTEYPLPDDQIRVNGVIEIHKIGVNP
ncbi:MAG: PPOX class F420-dependent oxidoreductase [Acidimicrobiia bacterium]